MRKNNNNRSVECKLNEFQNLTAHTLSVKHNHLYYVLIKKAVLMNFQLG